MAVLVNLILVLLLGALLGALVWGGGMLALARVVTGAELNGTTVLRPVGLLVAAAIVYCVLVMLIGGLGAAL